MSSSDSLERNVAAWTKTNADYTDEAAPRAWAREEIAWGALSIPESGVGALPDVDGLDVCELGCGTAYLSAWLARRGARVVAVDPTPAQLATARRMQQRFGLEFPLVQAPGEDVPLPSSSFDLVVSEYGASLWADPERWVPEAARLLRPGGRLLFLTNSPLSIICAPDVGAVEERLVRPAFRPRRTEWPDEIGVEFHLRHGEWLALLRASGFEVEALHELQAHDGAETHAFYGYVTAEWARKWPAEDIWVARKRA